MFEPFPNTVGGDADLMIDPNYLFNPVQAKLLCRAVEDCNITWFEGAFAPTRCPSARRPAHTYENTACAGQMDGHRWRLRELAERHAVDILQPNCCFCGGYTEARKAGHLARFITFRWQTTAAAGPCSTCTLLPVT